MTTTTFTANLLCFHDLADNAVCLFEGDVEYTITLLEGKPDGSAEAICPECGNLSEDEGVVGDYLDSQG